MRVIESCPSESETNGRVHALDFIMGNQGNMAGNSKVFMEIQSKMYCT